MSEIIVNSEPALQAAIGIIREAWMKSKYIRLTVKSRKRSLSQNDLVAVWYEQMAREDRQYDVLGHKGYCKLHHGVPICVPRTRSSASSTTARSRAWQAF